MYLVTRDVAATKHGALASVSVVEFHDQCKVAENCDLVISCTAFGAEHILHFP